MQLVSAASAFIFIFFILDFIFQAHTKSIFFLTLVSPGFLFAVAAGSAVLNQGRTSWKSIKAQNPD